MKVTNMPFFTQTVVDAQKYGHPSVYPNSENITPPLEKERLRIVEAASRTEVKLKQWKEIEERADQIKMMRKMNDIRYAKDIPIYTAGEFVDIEV